MSLTDNKLHKHFLTHEESTLLMNFRLLDRTAQEAIMLMVSMQADVQEVVTDNVVAFSRAQT